MAYERKLPSVASFVANNLDGALPNLQSGRYYRAPNAGPTTSNTLGNGSLRLMPKYIANAVTLTRLGAEVTVIGEAGSKIRLGIYADDGTFRPSALVIDAGQIAGDSATIQEITISQALSRGWYWFGGAVQSAPTTQPTVRTVNTIYEYVGIDQNTTMGSVPFYGFTQASVTGSLPSTLSGFASTGTLPSIFFKVG